jgi:hypothetical protein
MQQLTQGGTLMGSRRDDHLPIDSNTAEAGSRIAIQLAASL